MELLLCLFLVVMCLIAVTFVMVNMVIATLFNIWKRLIDLFK